MGRLWGEIGVCVCVVDVVDMVSGEFVIEETVAVQLADPRVIS